MQTYRLLSILLLTLGLFGELFGPQYSLAQSWTVVPSPNPGASRNFLNAVCSISPNDVWAVGSYDQQPSFTLIQHWDGVNWTTISSPNPAVRYNLLNAVQGWSSNNVYAVGYSAGIPSTPQMLILHWDGSSWTEQTTPTVTGGSSLQSIVIFGPNDIYAGGHKAFGSPGPTTGTLVTHWNGSSWNIEATPNQSQTRHNEITDMKGLSPNDIWAVGYSRNTGVGPGFYFQAMVLHKTISGWSIVPVPQSLEDENFLYSLDIIAPDNIWASGLTNRGGQYQTLFYHYNGTTWTEVTSPQGGYGFVHGSANDVWSTGSGFVHYDGITWSSVSAPIPFGGAMGSMSRISSTDIWAVGRTADGSNLRTLTMHYGNAVTGTAEYNAPLVFELAQNYPNPFNPTTAIRFEIPQSGFVSLKVFDVLGREVATLVNEEKFAGNYSVHWDATTAGSGTYFSRLESNGIRETRKMILMK